MFSKWFPEMYDRPENGSVAGSAIYWFICYFMIPFVTLFLSWALSSDLSVVIAVDLITYAVNFLCILGLFRSYLADSFWNVRTETSHFVITLLISTGTVLLIELALMQIGVYFDWYETFTAYPISETSVVSSTIVALYAHPLLGVLCMTILTPVTVSCMFYGTVFAPIATKRPLLAYAVTAALMLLPRMLSSWWLGVGNYDIAIYLLQLPVHMVACWSYQRTNTIWAPIFTLGITNLLISVLLLFLFAVVFLHVS